MDNLPTQRVAAPDTEGATVCLPPPPLEFGRYELLKELGKGGAGVVWLALDRELGQKVALKTLRAEMTSEGLALRELKSEVILNRSLTHPHIVKTFDFVTDGRASAISMEYVAGTNLQRLKTERPTGFFEADEIARWVAQLCVAMDYAHRQRVVHRDLKPANLMIDEHGDLKVGDFGIGRAIAETGSRLTRSSCGTPPFMSPQQTMGEPAVPSDDLYGIGATVYDLLTGDPPFFRGVIREQTLAKVAPPMEERRRELERKGQPIPPAWEKAVAAALSKEAGGRPATAADLLAMFEGKSAAATIAASRPRRTNPWIRAATMTVGAAAAAAIVAAAAMATAAYFGKLPAPIAAFASSAHDAIATRLGIRPQPPVAGPAARLAPSRGSDVPTASGSQAAVTTPLPLQTPLSERDGKPDLAAPALSKAAVGVTAPSTAAFPPPPLDPTQVELQQMLDNGVIKPKEFVWLASALRGGKGEDERALAYRFVDSRELTAAEWRTRSALYPPPPVDPLAEKLKPLVSAGRITSAERSWLIEAQAGRHGASEQARAAALLEEKSLTLGQWRARTSLPYPITAGAFADPAHLPPAIDLPLNARTALRLLRVDAGTFVRGTPEDEPGRRNNEPYPARTVIASPFYLGVTSVTQGQYSAVMPRNPSYWRGHADWPIDQVDWQSLAGPNGFLDRVNRLLARRWPGVLIADLPSNDEWEYACRAGTRGSFYRDGVVLSNLQRDPVLDSLANYDRSEDGSPQPVGSYAPNDWGFYDMLGNVAQWCQGRYVRGGSWQSTASGCRVGWRTQSNPDADTDPSPQIGFRLVVRVKSTYVSDHGQFGGGPESFAQGL